MMSAWCPAKTAHGLAETIVKALSAPRRTLDATGLALEREFRPTAVRRRYDEIYRALVTGAG